MALAIRGFSRTVQRTQRVALEDEVKIQVRKKERICILDISGEIKLGEPTKLLREKCKELLATEERLFVYNMTKVPWIDSSGVGEVVACRNRIIERGGQMKAVLKDKAHDIFIMFELQKVMDIYKDPEEALASFAD